MTLAQLENSEYKIALPWIERVVREVPGVSRKKKKGYGAKEMRESIVVQMRAHGMNSVDVIAGQSMIRGTMSDVAIMLYPESTISLLTKRLGMGGV